MLRLIATAVIASAVALPAVASDTFKGKKVTYIIATNPGGNYDAYGRLIGKYLAKKLGADKVIFKNLPGAGHIIGANTLFKSKPDGLTIGTFNTGLIYAQILKRKGIKFDLNEFSWVGKAAADARAMILSTDSGFKNFNDLAAAKDKVKFAASGVGSASYTETKMLSHGLNLNIEIIPGFKGNEGEMAMMRNEVAGQVGTRGSLKPFVDAGNGMFAFYIGGDYKPQAIEFAKDDKGKSIVNLIAAMSTLGRLTAAPPGVDPAVLNELRDGYTAVMNDAEFLAEAKKLGLPIQPTDGATVAKMVNNALQQSPDTVKIIAAAVDVKVPTLTVTSEILKMTKKNKVVHFKSGDKTIKAKISGSRTKIMLNGKKAKRKKLAAGMTCKIEYDPQHEANEPKAMDCKG